MSISKADSNRLNAQHSTGPTTPVGKARVSQNALQHGLLSRKLLLPTENQAEFDALLQQLQAELDPVGMLELALVERIAIAVWRQRRLVGAESATIALQQKEIGYQTVNKVMKLAGLTEENQSWVESMMRDTPSMDDPRQMLAEIDSFDASADLKVLRKNCPLSWQYLCEEVSVTDGASLAEEISEITDYLDQAELTLEDWLRSLAEDQTKTLRVLEVLTLVRQAAAVPNFPDVLARYQSALDNDVYKAARVLRETQKFRMDQAALNASAINEIK